MTLISFRECGKFMDLSMELYEDGIDISSPPYIEEELGIRKR